MERAIYERQFEAMKNEAQSWLPSWKEICKYIAPDLGFFVGDKPNHGKALDHKTLINGAPKRALRVMAAGMQSGLTSPARPWFKLGIPDPDLAEFDPVRLWLNQVQQRMMYVFSKSNIYNMFHSIYRELGAFGVGAGIVLEDFQSVIRGRSFTIGEYYIALGPDLRVNSFARQIWFRVQQMVDEFGINNVSNSVKNLYNNHSYYEWVQVYHLIMPNNNRIPGQESAKNKPFISVYWEPSGDQNKFLRISGFDEFPVVVPRWEPKANDVYSKSAPGWDALGDSKMLQKLEADKLMGLDKKINPPLQADSDIRTTGGVNALPGGVTYTSNSAPNAGVRTAYEVNISLQDVQIPIAQTVSDIERWFFNDLFIMFHTSQLPQMTAKEVAERQSEKLLMLGPIIERLENDLYNPLISRTFNIMYRGGIIPPPPQELQGMELKVEYISILAQAQKMVGITTVEKLANYVGTLAALYPEVRDKFNAEESIDLVGDMLGAPPKVVRSDEDVAIIRQQRAQEMQAQANAQNVMATIEGAKVLSDTKVGENNALTALLNGIG